MASSARRVVGLDPAIARDLESAEAPYRVVRWVAWGEDATACRRLADLALHLRHTVDTPRGGWLGESQLAAANVVLETVVAEGRHRGLLQVSPAEVPATAYEEAIRQVTRSKRRSPHNAAKRPPSVLLTEEERAALAVLDRLFKRAG